MFARPGLKAWKIVDFLQSYGIPHTDCMELVKKLDAIRGDNRNGYSLLFEDLYTWW